MSSVSSPSIPSPQPLIATGAWAADLGAHPCLLGPRRFLRQRAEEHPDFYARMKGLDAKQWRDGVKHPWIGTNDLLAAGIVHAVEGLPADRMRPYIDKALAIAGRGPTNNHQDSWIDMEQAVLAFDLFHDQLQPQEVQRIVDYLEQQLASFTDDETPFHNSAASKFHAYLRVAYGIWGHTPVARVFRDYAITRLYERGLVPVFREFGAGGGWTECGWYCRHSLWHLVQGLELARRFEGYDGYALCPKFFYQRLAYELHQPYPGLWERGAERYSSEGDGQQIYSEFKEFPRLMRTVIAQYFRGSELAQLTASRRRAGTSDHVRLFDFLYEEAPDKALAPAAARLPLSHLAQNIGKAYARSDWTPDATWLRFECGPWFNQHQHFEAGNFEIFHKDILANESGEYCGWADPYAVNWLVRTIAHNCLLINKPDEKWQMTRGGGQTEPANDGGQGNRSLAPFDLRSWKQHPAEYVRGHIAAYCNDDRVTYIAGDATAAYDPSKARRVLRQIVFIRPGLFVMLDSVISTQAEYQKTWLLHCQNEPTISGAGFSLQNGGGSLHVQTLLPESARMEKMHGPTYGGQTYKPAHSYHPPELLPQWRVEVRPGQATCEDLFLHVLSTAGPANASLAREGDSVGAAGSSPITWQVLLRPEGGGVVRLGGKEIVLEAKIIPGPYES